MRQQLIGEYALGDVAVAMAVFAFLCYWNYLFYVGIYEGGQVTAKVQFLVLFIDLMGFVIVSLPYLSKKAEGLPDERVRAFLDLPEKSANITFSTISEFLSNQALASFLVTVLVLTGKQVFAGYGSVIAVFYIVPMFVAAILLGCISLIQFILHFTKYPTAIYALAAVFSMAVMFEFLNLGVKMAS